MRMAVDLLLSVLRGAPYGSIKVERVETAASGEWEVRVSTYTSGQDRTGYGRDSLPHRAAMKAYQDYMRPANGN